MSNPETQERWTTERYLGGNAPEYLVAPDGERWLMYGAGALAAYLNAALARPEPAAGETGVVIAWKLYCPKCGAQHVDEGKWETRPHRTHLCLQCGNEWRVTVRGVSSTPTQAGERQAWSAVEDLAMAALDFAGGWGYAGKQAREAEELKQAARSILNARPFPAQSGETGLLEIMREIVASEDAFIAANGGTEWRPALKRQEQAINAARDFLRRLDAAQQQEETR